MEVAFWLSNKIYKSFAELIKNSKSIWDIIKSIPISFIYPQKL